jgi:hypothetical protein
MPLRQEIQFLRERARRLREIAATHRTALSDQLRQMADELEARANEIEQDLVGQSLAEQRRRQTFSSFGWSGPSGPTRSRG